MKRPRKLILKLSLLTLLAVGCDSSVRTSADVLPNLRENVVRVRLSANGMANLYDAANPEGLPVIAAPTAFLMGADTVQLGPIDAALPVNTRSFQPSEDLAATLTRLSSFRTFVPVRITSATETRICKFQIETSEIDIVAAVGLELQEGTQVLAVVDTPNISAGTVTAEPFGPCDTEVDLNMLIDPVQNYVRNAIVTSAGSSLEAPLVSELGLLNGSVELRPKQTLTTQGGEMVISQVPSNSGVQLTPNGVALALNARVGVDRSACVSPTTPGEGIAIQADDVDVASLNSRNADLALAVSIQTLTSIAEGTTLSGLGCFDIDGPLDEISRDEAALSDIGLGNIGASPTIFPVVIPGSLPVLSLDADSNRVRLSFSSLTVEAHSEMFGVIQRLVSIDAEVVITLTIQPGSPGLRFEIESIQVDRAVPDTKWARGLPGDIKDWVRRFLLLTLGSRFAYQLPISPEFPVRALEAEVRPNDVVIYVAIGE